MNRVIHQERLSNDVFRMEIESPDIARNRKPGQFVVLQLDSEFSERIPLTIADVNLDKGTITVIFQAVGKTTINLSKLGSGDFVENILGPLGQPTHIEKIGHVVCVGGGIGVAPLRPIAEAMQKAGNKVTSIIGARNSDLLILEDDMTKISDELIVCTDDGSKGRKCLVTDPLKELCEGGNPPDLVVAIGPGIMMKFCCLTTKPFNVKTLVSLNTIMIDGTGMCGGCRVTVGNETKFVCVDGPEFDGHQVDFDNMMSRLKTFVPHETEAKHSCRMDAKIDSLQETK